MNGVGRRVNFVTIAGVVVMIAAASGAARATPEIPKSPPDGYVVLPFANESGAKGLDWMRLAVPASLGELLEAHPSLRPAYGELIVPPGALAGDDDATRVAAAGGAAGARWVFAGTVKRPNWKLELTMRLWRIDGAGDDAKATLVGEKKQRGDFADCFEIMTEEALELLARGGRKLDAAQAQALERAPTGDFYAYTLWGRGLTALHGAGGKSDLRKAEKDLQRSVFIDPKFAEAHRLLAIVYGRKGQEAKAKGQLDYALELRPDYYAPLAELTRIAYRARERSDAIELAGRALSIRAWDVELRYLLAEMLWDEGDADEAFLELKRITAFDANHLAARRILVLIHASKGDTEELAGELEKIIALDPDDEPAHLDLAAAYHALGRDGDAIDVYGGIVAKNPRHMQALKMLGDLYRSRGDLKTAISWYEKALATNADDPRPYFLLGAAYVDDGDVKAAIKVYERAERFTKYLGETWSNLGSIHYREGDNDTALWYLAKAVKRKPKSANIHYNYGLALSRAKKRERAVTELSRAVELDGTVGDYHYALGVVYLRMGKVEDAEQGFRRAAELDPANDDARHNLALIEELRRRATEGEVTSD